jgi:putative ABC transport system substrate-binding protein
VDLIATFGTPPTHAAKEATRTIPIVMIGIGDPVGAGLVSSLARPGGNITGNTILGPEVSGKRVELIKELIPSVARVAFLWNPNNTSHPAQLAELHSVVRTFGMQLIPVAARSQEELDNALAATIGEHADAFLMTADPLHQISIMKILDFLSSNRLPGMFTSKEIVAAGGLISYGASVPDLFRRGALYAHKILQGAKPADLPVEQPTKFELAFNLNTAKALGLTIPPRVLAIADEVIE